MELATLEARLRAAVQPHDLLCHPFYQAWSQGSLTRDDLRGYAAQYQHQVDALPGLLRRALAQLPAGASAEALRRNLDEEEGRVGAPHAELWRKLASALGDVRSEEPLAATVASARELEALVQSGEVAALAALWTYEMQTARVARTKREGLAERYGVASKEGLAFFALHEELDVHHAADLLAAVGRACRTEADVARACQAAEASARAQWRFLDGVESRRAAAA